MAQALRAVETNDNDTASDANIVVQVSANPAMVILDRERFGQFYDAIKEETDKLVPDLTTEKGRAAIASMAFKVTKTKTAIDAAGKLLKEEAQATVTKVDAARRDIRLKLEALSEEVRAPLTAWEDAEKARVAKVQELVAALQRDAIVSADETGADIEARLTFVRDRDLDAAVFLDRLPEAQAIRGDTISALERALERIRREEADRAELERLRAEAAEREAAARAEAEAKAAAEAEQRAKDEAVARAERAAAEEKARVEAAAKAAEESARIAAEAKANEERLAQQRAHDEALAAEKRRADEAEAARKAEADRIARETAAREAEAKAAADAAAARAADIEHRGKIMGAAKQAIMGHGVGEATARAIVLAIAAGDVPHTSIRF